MQFWASEDERMRGCARGWVCVCVRVGVRVGVRAHACMRSVFGVPVFILRTVKSGDVYVVFCCAVAGQSLYEKLREITYFGMV